MKITIIHGQSHKGSTYHIARMLAEKLEGDITEFFLPRDFGAFCIGCTRCFEKSESMCPHYETLKPITPSDLLCQCGCPCINAPFNPWLDLGPGYRRNTYAVPVDIGGWCTVRRSGCSESRLSAFQLPQGAG